MEEELISLETAKLAKEKGFNELSVLVVYNPPKISESGTLTKGIYTKRTYDYYKESPKDNIERIHLVRQTLLQKWLREVHNIYVTALPSYADNNKNKKCFFEIAYDNKLKQMGDKYSYFETHEEALEAGLQEALNLIK